ncbi:MAG: 3-phosphoshikimate 1-carboxyvinyltransferase [Candidatus Eutrophobiaceae bacterium]
MNGLWSAPCGNRLCGELRIPGDKSISHRALILAAIANGTSHIKGFLPGADNIATLRALQDLGVEIERTTPDEVTIQGTGMYGLKSPKAPLDLGNSGTGARLLSGLLAAQRLECIITGDASLSRRPMRRILEPLRRMGARIDAADSADTLPLHLFPVDSLRGIEWVLEPPSAQVKSAILLSALHAEGQTCIIEKEQTRDHTERMLANFGHPVQRRGERIYVTPAMHLSACDLRIPSDLSSAAFFIVAACIVPGSHLHLHGVGINPTRTAVLHLLLSMGADIRIHNERLQEGEPIADLEIRQTPLHGINIPQELVANAIDEFPILFIAAACAEGTTTLFGAEELRVKESDRISAMTRGLQTLGIDAEPTADGLTVQGGKIEGGVVEDHGDHRVAMAFLIAGSVAKNAVRVNGCQHIETSFPGFAALAQQAGLSITH